ncbi:hypothetical protein G7Z17_g13385 [Cylindrodendrum hubeiense]|uniref:CHY-type domain-containing protein n=1 Tax=Cylindrodendrum hubeiense TaxID=595255 RepID=A0A9P5L9L6_9HYPO|nr:hypothetical protein G7Z17_g13385 [Cylindrodendrum hubeiense]
MISLQAQEDGSPQTREQAVLEPSPSRIVPKPVPESQTQDPRRYQIEQLRRRYSPKETNAPHGATSLIFKLAPSDPDFPFELAHLDCDLRVPWEYPEEKPTLFVRNKDIPRGFGINIERGWEKLVEEKPEATLLALTRELDKKLETFLSEQKVETVKLVSFKDTRHLRALAAEENATPVTPTQPEPAKPAPRAYVPEPSYTKDQIAVAKARRATEVRQLEARMGRMPMYHRSPDGIVYTLPIEPKRRPELPSGLQGVQTLHLIIPLIYPLQNLRVQLNEVDSNDAEPVEDLFSEKAAEQQHMTLMSHLNYLAQNLHKLAKQAQAQVQARVQAEAAKAEALKATIAPLEVDKNDTGKSVASGEKSHIQFITRPPEWSLVIGEDDSTDEDTDPEDEAHGGVALGAEDTEATPVITDTPERGTMISFPSIELHGIEIIQVSILSLSVKCERCKTINDAAGLKPGVEKPLSCKKCASSMAVTFRAQLVHEHSSRAGFLDLSGCKVADMLPSTFIPTCARCSTSSLGLVSVRGETVTNICRDCHAKFTFKIPEVKFLFITPGSLPPPTTGPRRKQEKLGLHAGEPLPNKGACQHYRKSYRWFRFSCCSRVHPCDKCHDDGEDHVNEWANRMICGWCSREQNYAVEACGFCGRSVIGRKGKGFWEGGRGTRDQRTMSRKDPRKHKRIVGSQAAKKT